MPLFTSGTPSASSHGDVRLYKLRESSNLTSSSTQLYSSNKITFKHGTDTCYPDNNNQHYFPGPPIEVPEVFQTGFDISSNHIVLDTLVCPSDCGSSSAVQNPCHTFLEHDADLTDYIEDEIKLKLKELETALLDDEDENNGVAYTPHLSVKIDNEWTSSLKDILPDSPKESSPLDSYSSSMNSSRATALTLSSITSLERVSLKQLLYNCATSLCEGNIEEASNVITKLREMVSVQGDPQQRIAAYMVEGLAARIAASGKGLYKALKCKDPPASDRLSAMQILFEVCPCFKFGFMAANGAIAEALKGEETVHIIDFDVNQGSQYIALIQALAAQPDKPPCLRITGVDDPESVQREVGGLKMIGQRLEKLAEEMGVPFKFQAMPSRTADVTPSMLNCQSGEALVVNFAFQLHHIPDESVSTTNQRDLLLQMVRSLNPKLVTVVEQDVNTNTTPFIPRFIEACNYYSAIFESLDATLPRESPDRMNVERHCLARDIVNIVACEGEERIERYEVASKWRARMTMAGFNCSPMSSHVSDTIRELSKQYCGQFRVKEEEGVLHFGWEDMILVVASAWR